MQIHTAPFSCEVFVNHVQKVPDMKRVATFEVTRDLLHMLLDLGIAIGLRICLTPASDALIGLNLDEQEVLSLSRIPDKRLNVRYFHWRDAFQLAAVFHDC